MAPFLAVFANQGIYPGETLGSCGVLDRCQIAIFKHFEQGVEELPRDLNLILPRKQRLIASHAIQKKSLVCFGGLGFEDIVVIEIHRQRTHASLGTGAFGLEAQLNPLSLLGRSNLSNLVLRNSVRL